MLRHSGMALAFALRADRVRRLLDPLLCFIEGDGIVVALKFGRNLEDLTYYQLTFEHEVDDTEHPAGEEYLSAARTTRVVRCADKATALLIAEALSGEGVYAAEYLGRCIEVRKADGPLVAAWQSENFAEVWEMIQDLGLDITSRHPPVFRMPPPSEVERGAYASPNA